MWLRQRWNPVARACVAGLLTTSVLPGAWGRDKRTIAAFPAGDEIAQPAIGERAKLHPIRGLQSPVNTRSGALMIGPTIATSPLATLFTLHFRQLISGLNTGAVK